MNSKTKSIIIVLVTVIAAAVILGLLLLPVVADKSGKTEDTTLDTTKDNTPEKDTQKADPNAAPDFKVYDMKGNAVTLSEKKGKPVIVNFWATWCPPCVGELPHFNAMYEKYGDKIEFMMVDLTDGYDETEAKVKSFIDKNGYTFPVYLDSDINAVVAYKISSIPLTVFVDENGRMVNSQVGAMDESTLEGYIKNLLGE